MDEIKVTGTVQKGLEDLEKRMKDMTPAFKDIADFELAQTRLRYTKEEDPDGEKWIEPFTIRRDGGGGRNNSFENPWEYVVKSNYQAAPPGYHFFDRARGDKVLRDTGTLFASIGRSYGADYAVVGSNLEYAKKNQDGEGATIPRPFLGLNKKSIDNVRKVIAYYLTGDLK